MPVIPANFLRISHLQMPFLTQPPTASGSPPCNRGESNLAIMNHFEQDNIRNLIEALFPIKKYIVPFERRVVNYYEGANGKKYVYKHDILMKIQNLFPPKGLVINECILAYFLRAKENDLLGQCELVQYDKSAFKIFAKRLKKRLDENTCYKLTQYKPKRFPNWTEILPENKDDPDYKAIKGFMKSITSKFKGNKIKTMHGYYDWSKSMFEVLNSFMEEKPDWFRSSESYAIVRLFRLHQNFEFVFVRELLTVMRNGNMYVSEFMKKIDNMNEFAIIGKEEILERIGETNMNKIEFFFMPIVQSEHLVTCVQSFQGISCTPAIDVVKELHEAIQGEDLLQRANQDDFDQVFGLFKDLKMFNKNDLTRPLLIDTKRAVDIRTACRKGIFHCLEKLKKGYSSELETYSLKKFDGDYTLELLEAQLNGLGISKNFPDIVKILPEFFGNFDSDEIGIDIAGLIETCQLAYIYKKLPNVTKFFHDQKACHQLFLECTYCAAEEKAKWKRAVDYFRRGMFSQFDDVKDSEVTHVSPEEYAKQKKKNGFRLFEYWLRVENKRK